MKSSRIAARLSLAFVCVALIGLYGVFPTMAKKEKVLFIQQDKIVTFALTPFGGFEGAQTGTATGAINGASIVTYKGTFTPFPNYAIDNRVGITDTDGDQIIFRMVGTGRFITPPLLDPTVPVPANAAPYQVFGNGLGGPSTGTYEVVATSGKYSSDFDIGQAFPYRAVSYNPPFALTGRPTPSGTTGSAYVEVLEP
jgi:hypothetical protein